ncbi:MAG: 16S rRNA (guanine(527)-N(7))-methyltransferase RsmG [Dehalococcoidia bacterium]
MQNGPSEAARSALATLRLEVERLDLARAGLPLDEPALDRFGRYLDLLLEWNERAGLTTVTAPDEVARRHFGESLALLIVLRRELEVSVMARVVDLGSGAGFPGLPIAIAAPSMSVTLVETHTRRAEFLRAVASELGLANVEVVHARAEDAARDPALREHFDVAIARALAALRVLVELGVPFLRPGGLLAAPKGSRALDELSGAAAAIQALGARPEEPVMLPLAEAPRRS